MVSAMKKKMSRVKAMECGGQTEVVNRVASVGPLEKGIFVKEVRY